jgi:hypothetical protein
MYNFTRLRMVIIVLKIANVGEDVERLEPLYTISRNVKWCSHCGKYYGNSSKY